MILFYKIIHARRSTGVFQFLTYYIPPNERKRFYKAIGTMQLDNNDNTIHKNVGKIYKRKYYIRKKGPTCMKNKWEKIDIGQCMN